MLVNQHFFPTKGIPYDAKAALRPSAAEFTHTYDAKTRELVDAIAAAVVGAYAGLNWLRAQPPNLEEIQQALDSIADDGKRAYEIVVELRALMTERVHGG